MKRNTRLDITKVCAENRTKYLGTVKVIHAIEDAVVDLAIDNAWKAFNLGWPSVLPEDFDSSVLYPVPQFDGGFVAYLCEKFSETFVLDIGNRVILVGDD